MLLLLDSQPCLERCFDEYFSCRGSYPKNACVSKIMIWCRIDYVCLQLFFLISNCMIYHPQMPIDMFAKTDSTSVVHNHCFNYTYKRYADHHDLIATHSCRLLLSDWLDIWWTSSFSLNPVLFISMLWTDISRLFQVNELNECTAKCQ